MLTLLVKTQRLTAAAAAAAAAPQTGGVINAGHGGGSGGMIEALIVNPMLHMLTRLARAGLDVPLGQMAIMAATAGPV